MSKKINQTETTTTTVEENPISAADILRNQMESHPNVSLRKLSIASNRSYARLMNARKKPIPNVPYDPEAINYEALAEVLGTDKILDIRWDELNEVDATKVSLVKDISTFEVGNLVHMRKDKEAPFRIIHITKTHIVIQRVDQETPYSWSHNTFMLYGPSLTARTKEAATVENLENLVDVDTDA